MQVVCYAVATAGFSVATPGLTAANADVVSADAARALGGTAAGG
ncbi:hypothetical protein SAMN04489712_106182 [Thermomonospora echinospora]|uniref:Uncharacterized protein n=1 Tax=Thermomonospora echinospora TaxID=1992 RepID=A0A1H6B2J5_9ACTN|nr:hypothetical protein [Thermomonospora echinospora]SEG54822.1 hypothetical protein SAMN04489712_106182 [Thermomonospora echinospora]